MTPWELRLTEFTNCNCDFGCPCQFNSLPTHGDCSAVASMEVVEGHYGDVRLDGLRFGGIFSWPGAIHEGHGQVQPFIDERATPQQREALLKIMSGEDTDPMATMFSVFASTMEKVHDPVVAKVDFSVDVEGETRQGARRRPVRGPRRTDPQSGHRRRAPGAHRPAAWI